MKIKGAALLAAVVALATGCSSREPAQDTTSRPGGTSSSTASASPSGSSPPPTLDLPIGRTFSTSLSSITVRQVKAATSEYSQLPDNQRWWAVRVKSCVKKLAEGEDGVSFSWSPWSITGEDGGTYPASDSTWSDFPRPEYPFAGERAYLKGQCVQGWMMFALDAKTKPATVEYGNSVGEVASWKVS